MIRHRRSAAGWTMVALLALTTGLVCLSATRSVLTATGVLEARVADPSSVDGGLLVPFDAEGVRFAEGATALLSVPVALLALLLLVGVATWRTWALDAVLGVYGILGLLLATFSLAGLGESPNAVLGLGGALLLLGAAGLSVSPPVRADVDRVRIEAEVRERRRREQERRERQAGSS